MIINNAINSYNLTRLSYEKIRCFIRNPSLCIILLLSQAQTRRKRGTGNGLLLHPLAEFHA